MTKEEVLKKYSTVGLYFDRFQYNQLCFRGKVLGCGGNQYIMAYIDIKYCLDHIEDFSFDTCCIWLNSLPFDKVKIESLIEVDFRINIGGE